MLSSRPELSWRDVQQLIVETAQMTDPQDADWSINGAGRYVSHKYGFGKMDANLLVSRSMTHQLLPRNRVNISKSFHCNLPIRYYNNNQFLSGKKDYVFTTSIEINDQEVHPVGLEDIEHVQVKLKLTIPERRHLTIKLISPSGTESILAAPRFQDNSTEGFPDWTFMTVRLWGEKPQGLWSLVIKDQRIISDFTNMETDGHVHYWTLTVHGTCSSKYIIYNPKGGSKMCSKS
jgi:subtilisin-like proprotein convertase family protein